MGNLWYNKDVTVVQPAQRDIWAERKKYEGKLDWLRNLFGSHTVGGWTDVGCPADTNGFSFRTVAGNSDWASNRILVHDHRSLSEGKQRR